jgi:hypothetical protein
MKRDPLHEFVSLRANLLKRKAALEAELSRINQALAVSAATVAPRKRARNAVSLKDAVLAATKEKPLSKPEILEAIGKAGYVFTAKSPINSLNTLLYSDKAFKNHGGTFGPA